MIVRYLTQFENSIPNKSFPAPKGWTYP